MATNLSDILSRTKKKIAQNRGQFEKPERIPSGKSRWRILPGWDEKNPQEFFHAFGQHYIKNADGKVVAVLVCRERTFGESDCEVCNMISDAYDHADTDEDRAALKDMKATQRYLVNAIRTDAGEAKVVMLEMPQTLFEGLCNIMEEWMDEDENTAILDTGPDGVDIVISKDGTGLNTDYSVTPAPKSKSKPVDKNLLMQLKDLATYVDQVNEQGLRKAAAQIGNITGEPPAIGGPGMTRPQLTGPRASATAEDDEEDETPATPPKPKLDLTATADDAEEESEEAEPEVEEAEVVDEEPAKPAKKAEGKPADNFGEDVSDDDLAAMLDDL